MSCNEFEISVHGDEYRAVLYRSGKSRASVWFDSVEVDSTGDVWLMMKDDLVGSVRGPKAKRLLRELKKRKIEVQLHLNVEERVAI